MNKLIAIIFLGMASCTSKINQDEPLTISKRDIVGSPLKLNGYYYLQEPDSQSIISRVLFLYSNGVILDRGAYNTNNLSVVDSILLANLNKTTYTKRSWGIININNFDIIMESWATQTSVYKRFREEGNILNDTTFNIDKIFGSNNKIQPLNNTYHFHQFSPKPDSTNNFIP
jgi:hypothetical protein